MDLRSLHRRLDDPGDARRDLVLKLEDIFEQTIEPVGPKMRTALRIDQLTGDPYALASFANRPLEHVAHTEFTADPLYVDGLALIGEARIAGDHEEPSDARQRGDDLL